MSLSKSKYPVAVNIFPTLDYIELVQLNDATGEIQVATSMPCAFDPTTRQIQDLDILAQGLRDLFSSNKIPFNTPVVMIIPSFFTREIDLPNEFNKDELKFALISEAERFHVFKNLEPQVDWFRTAPHKFLYSAYPKTEIEKFSAVFQELHIPLKAIELNYFSILRGLLATGTVSDEESIKEPWGLMVVTDTNFFLALMQGTEMMKITDTPLSLNALTDEMIEEIEGDYRLFEEKDSFTKLVVVNNATKLQTDRILERLNVSVPVANIDQNMGTLSSRGGVNAPFPCSLEGIGGVFYTQITGLPTLDFKQESIADVSEIAELKDKAFKIALAVCIATFLLILIFWGILSGLVWMKDEEIKSKTQTTAKLGLSASPGEYSDIQRKLFVKKAMSQNIVANDTVISLGKAIKNGLWLNQAELTVPLKEDVTQTTPPIQLKIEGEALDANQINQLNTELKDSLKRTDLEVPVTEEKTQGDTTYWHWVIDSKDASAAASAAPGPGGASGAMGARGGGR